MGDKIRKIATIICFFAIITIPLITFEPPGRSSIVQNKVTASIPNLTLQSLFDKTTLSQIEQMIDDNIGYKDEATLFYIGANYHLFDNLAISGYERGNGGHFLYFQDNILKNYQGLSQPTTEQCVQMVKQFEHIDVLANQLGSKLFFMPIPNKEAIYPEAVPDYIVGSADNGIFESLTSYIREHSDLSLVPTKHYLLNYKQSLTDRSDILYFKNIDVTHWNSYGMYVGYQALMNTIQNEDPNISFFTEDEILIERVESRSALAWLQGSKVIQYAFQDLTDFVYTITPKSGWTYQSDNSEPSEFLLANDTQDRYFRYVNPQAKNDKSILIYGDSYIYSFMLPLLAETFSEVYFLSANTCGTAELSSLLQCVQTDYTLLERVERMADYGAFSSYLTVVETAFQNQFYDTAIQTSNNRTIDIHFDIPNMETTHQLSRADFSASGVVNFSGWAADFAEMTSPPAVVIQIGDLILNTTPMQRPDLQSEFYYGGFSVAFPLSELDGVSELKVYALTADQQGTYLPVTITIV